MQRKCKANAAQSSLRLCQAEDFLMQKDIQKSICARLKIFLKRKKFFHQEKNFQFGAELFTRFKCLNIRYVDKIKISYGFPVRDWQ